MYTQFLGTTRRSLTAFGGPGYPQFRAKGAPFLRFASEQPLRAAATIPGAFRTESIKKPAHSVTTSAGRATPGSAFRLHFQAVFSGLETPAAPSVSLAQWAERLLLPKGRGTLP